MPVLSITGSMSTAPRTVGEQSEAPSRLSPRSWQNPDAGDSVPVVSPRACSFSADSSLKSLGVLLQPSAGIDLRHASANQTGGRGLRLPCAVWD
jgi:hypothetical protein